MNANAATDPAPAALIPTRFRHRGRLSAHL